MICYCCDREIHQCGIPVRENGVEIYFCDNGCLGNHYAKKNRKSPNPQGGDMWPYDKKEAPKDD